MANDRVTAYCHRILNGEEPAGHLEKLACKRHLADMARAEDPAFPYRFDVERAAHIIQFAETLTILEGYERKPLRLFPFQAFILGSLNGWVRKNNGYRRFRSSYIQLGRQNGKSLLNGIMNAYYGNFSGYQYGQIYCVATKKDQAKIVYNETVKFIRADPELEELFKIKEYTSEIECLLTHSLIKALSKDTSSIDGFRPLLGIVDEYHAHKTNQMYKLLEGGQKRMAESLISVITTAGFDLDRPCHEMYEDCVGVLEGVFSMDSRFIFITQMDEEDDWWSVEGLLKANKSLIGEDEMIRNTMEIGEAARRKPNSRDYIDYVTKQLNIWLEFSDDQYIAAKDWKKGATDLTLENFRGQHCVVGLDLSSGGDMTAFVLIVPFTDEGVKKYFLHAQSYIPRKKVEEHIKSDLAPYDLWIRNGLLTATATNDGVKNDYHFILAELEALAKKYDLTIDLIGYDPHNADAFLVDLEEIADCVEIYQGPRYICDATEDFQLEVKAGHVLYNRNSELLTWSVTNAKVIRNANGEMKIDKFKRGKRIDPVDAAIDGHKLIFKQEKSFDMESATQKYLERFG